MQYIRGFPKGFQDCQLHKVGSTSQKQIENRINMNYTSMSKVSCDIKCMYRTGTGHSFILVVTDE